MSVVATVPLKVRPSARVTVISVAPAMTWLLVTIQPAASTITPEPTPSAVPPKRPPPWEVVSMVTTAGPTVAAADSIAADASSTVPLVTTAPVRLAAAGLEVAVRVRAPDATKRP